MLLFTTPPFVMVSVPVPKLPTFMPPAGPLFQTEPGPVTITAPCEPADNPIELPAPLFNVPPFCTVSAPIPWPPTVTLPLFQAEPTPVTITVSNEPGKLPTAPPKLLTGPPFWMVRLPVPIWLLALFATMVLLEALTTPVAAE